VAYSAATPILFDRRPPRCIPVSGRQTHADPDDHLRFLVGVIFFLYRLKDDFHGEPSNDPKQATRDREEQKNTKPNGAFVAPFEAIHGWFWRT